MSRNEELLQKVNKLVEAYKTGLLGGEKMPEDENPHLDKASKEYIQAHKKEFPYLGGNKICNYWLYVLEQYTDIKFVDRENITVAPDTHVVQASTRLGVISPEEAESANVQELLAERWTELLKGTELVPIDVHTPMWLWSRGKFEAEI